MSPRAAPEPARVDAWVNAWIGTPFAWDGRTREGVDCWGLVWCFYRDVFGVVLPDWRAVGHGPSFRAQSFAQGRETLWRAGNGQIDGNAPALALAERGTGAHHIGILWRGRVVHADRAAVVAVPLAMFARVYGAPELGTIEGAPACRAA